MPSLSKAQRRVAAIAEHSPDKLYKRNRGMLGMGKDELHIYASTPEKGLPEKKKEGALRRLKAKA